MSLMLDFFNICLGMLQAIAFLHKNKVLHRDLKSANLMMTILVSDFIR